MNKEIKTAPLETINNNDHNESIDKLIKKIEINQKECKYMSGELCKLLKEVKEDFITLQTPFDIVHIKLTKNKKSEITETEVSTGNWLKYVNLSEAIEELIPDKQERLKSLKKIYEYLSILKDGNIKSIEQFNNKIKDAFKVENTNQYDKHGKNIRKKGKKEEESKRHKNISLAYLSAILMISEPFRFNDGGGLSRGAIRYMYVNLMNGKNDAISYTLGSKKKESHLLFAREGGKNDVLKKIKKRKNMKDLENENTENMELGYLSGDDEDNNKKEYSLRSKGLSEEENKIYENSFHSKLGKFIKNKKANMKTNRSKNRKINMRGGKIKHKRIRGVKFKSKIKKQK